MFGGKKGGGKHSKEQGAFHVTLPGVDSAKNLLPRTSGASGSRNDQVGEISNPTKRVRDDSQDESNPGKKLDNKDSPMKSAPTGSDTTVEDEVGNLTEEEMITQITQVNLNDEAATYAGAAKRPRVNLPDLLYIQKGTERREPIQKVHYDAFIEYLLESIFNMKAEESAKVQIDWHGWGLGRGIVACLTPETASFVKEVASSFKFNGLLFKAWGKNEFGSRVLFSGRLAGLCWQKRKPLDTVKWIFNMNGLKNLEFYLISYIKTPQGVLLRFEASRELQLALAACGFTLNAGIAKLKLEKKVINSSFELSEAINLENADGDNSLPNETATKQS